VGVAERVPADAAQPLLGGKCRSGIVDRDLELPAAALLDPNASLAWNRPTFRAGN
jgi:hypothetical protein